MVFSRWLGSPRDRNQRAAASLLKACGEGVAINWFTDNMVIATIDTVQCEPVGQFTAESIAACGEGARLVREVEFILSDDEWAIRRSSGATPIVIDVPQGSFAKPVRLYLRLCDRMRIENRQSPWSVWSGPSKVYFDEHDPRIPQLLERMEPIFRHFGGQKSVAAIQARFAVPAV